MLGNYKCFIVYFRRKNDNVISILQDMYIKNWWCKAATHCDDIVLELARLEETDENETNTDTALTPLIILPGYFCTLLWTTKILANSRY
jgi:hypothetical protein